jgi:alpha-D-ribose 1-methylphosphonate 5-phosphate C-P lyase
VSTRQPARRHPFAFIDEHAKREIRRKVLKAIAIPGYQVPFASRELPIARGWGTGGLQVTMALIGRDDVLKVIDQGSDAVVNAVNLRGFLVETTGVATTLETAAATLIQTRHRIPEERLRADQILVFQVPYPEPLYFVEPSGRECQRMHAEADYARMWVHLYESIARWGEIRINSQYPVVVEGRYLTNPSPIPRWDVPKLHMAEALHLFGAGREKRIYAIPPLTRVEPLSFDDVPFRVEDFAGQRCHRCDATHAYLDEVWDGQSGQRVYACSDSAYCDARRGARLKVES